MRLRGFIDGIVEGHVFGWALDMDEPGRRLTVSGVIDGAPVGSVVASEPRQDLKRAGIGDGSSGFRLKLVRELDQGEHELVVVVHPTNEPLSLANDWVVLDDQGRPIPGMVLGDGGSATVPAPSGAARDRIEPPEPELSVTGAFSATAAILGEAGWLFERPASGFDRLRGVVAPSHVELDRHVAAIEALHRLARESGAASLVASVPDKLHVYRDHLPAGLLASARGRIAALVIARLRDSDEGDLLDLLPTLLDARTHGRLFSRAGASLTWVGAFHAYRAIAKSLQGRVAGLTPLPADTLDLGPLVTIAGSLESLRKLAWIGEGITEISGLTKSVDLDLEPTLGDAMHLRAVEAGSTGLDVGQSRWERLDRPDLPSALVVSDSAGIRISRLLAEQFSRCVVVESASVSPELVPAHWPDVLIQLTSDRTLSA